MGDHPVAVLDAFRFAAQFGFDRFQPPLPMLLIRRQLLALLGGELV